jgi:hypothetical protein
MLQISTIAPDSKLKKLIALLASNHDGEVLAAARMIGRHLQAIGRDFNDLAAMATSVPMLVTGPEPQWRVAARECLQHKFRLKQRDLDFLYGLLTYDEPTEKQLKWLHDCLRRVQS